MKTQTRIRQNVTASRAIKQAPKKSESVSAKSAAVAADEGSLKDALRILLDLPGLNNDGEPIWFAPDGRLFLWTGSLGDAPREIGFKEGHAWFELYAARRPEFEPPLLPEETAGRELVDFVTRTRNKNLADEKTVGVASVPASEPAGESSSAWLDPAIAAGRAIDAIALLRCKANEAGAMALLLADAVKMQIKDADGWQAFAGVPGVEDGLHGLAHSAAFRLSGAVDEQERNMQPMIARLRAEKTSVPPARISHEAGRALLAAAGIDCPADSTIWLEDAVLAMQETILLPARALDHRERTNYFAANFTSEALEKAWKEFWDAKAELRLTAIALLAGQGDVQRQAA